MLLDFLQPVYSIDEGLVSSDIVSQEDTVSSSVEDPGDTLEGLLACSVPYLKLDNLIRDGPSEGPKLNTNSDLMLSLELIVLYSAHQATLAHSSVTNYNQLEQVILCG